MNAGWWIVWGAVVLEGGIRLALACRVVARRISIPATLAWLLVLFFAPLVGIFAYLLVGENRLGRGRAAEHEARAAGVAARALRFWRTGRADWTEECEPYEQVARVSTAVGGLAPLRGNTLTLLHDSDEMLDALIADVERAREHCHILTYIWMKTEGGLRVGEAVSKAAQRGVACRVLVDGVGSRPFLRSDLCRQMRRAGVQVVAALPVSVPRMLLRRLDLRNHRKIACIDGRIAYTGSQNIADYTFRVSRRPWVGPWIDATVRVEGPAAQALETVFLSDWRLDADSWPEIESLLPDLGECPGGSIVHVVPSGPGKGPTAVHEALVTALYSAREEIIITTPYFVPDEPMGAALRSAAMRGVDVTIVAPRQSDSPIVSAAGRAWFDELLDAGVRLMQYDPALLHSKTITIDRRVAIVGSANFDVRSFYLNFEITLFVYDSDFASLLRLLQKQYMSDSTDVEPHAWRSRSRVKRAAESVARLLSPLL